MTDITKIAEALRREALAIFDGPETAQETRDVIEWYTSSLQVAATRQEPAPAQVSEAQEATRVLFEEIGCYSVQCAKTGQLAPSKSLLDAVNHLAALASRETQAGPNSKAAHDVLAERRRQVEVEHWHPEHDDEHEAGELALAASCYAEQGPEPYGVTYPTIPARWPWEPDAWKPKDYRSNLVRAGALILAEIERLDRAAPSPTATEGGEG